jgi:hypothetical protein
VEFGATLRSARASAELSQRQLARRARTSQARISSYESGKLTPEPQTQRRLLQATRPLPSVVLDRCRDEVKRLAAAHRLLHVRVFGSVARGTDTLSSDIDLLVTPDDGASLLDMAGFMLDVEALTGYKVDVVSDAPLTDESEIVAQALWL